jgi:cupin 2 domain-containing protein
MNEQFNFLKNIPKESSEEIFQTLHQNKNVRIERIISYGQTSPKEFWYDQKEDEFVLVLEGSATIEYNDGRVYKLVKNDSLYIKAHQKHRVAYTENPTVWLTLFIS